MLSLQNKARQSDVNVFRALNWFQNRVSNNHTVSTFGEDLKTASLLFAMLKCDK